MSFACRFQSGALYPIPAIPLVGPYTSTGTGSDVSLTINFKSDGTLVVSRVQGNSGSSTVLDATWYSQAVSGIGTNFYVRLDVSVGSAPNLGNSNGGWLRMNVSRDFGWQQSVAGSRTATCSFQIATDSGGSNVVSTVSGISIDATYT